MGIVKQNRDNMDNNIYISLVLSSLFTLLCLFRKILKHPAPLRLAKCAWTPVTVAVNVVCVHFAWDQQKEYVRSVLIVKMEQKAARELVRKERKQMSVKNVKPIFLIVYS